MTLCIAIVVLLIPYSGVLTYYIILIIEKHNILTSYARSLERRIKRIEEVLRIPDHL